jgi:hypothetical protein
MKRRTLLFTICASAMGAGTRVGRGSVAQEQQKRPEGTPAALEIKGGMGNPGEPLARMLPMQLPGGNLLASLVEINFERQVVKGAPFSADAVTESTHVLADGNRIVNTSSSRLSRDSEGRTRREQSRLPPGVQVETADVYRSITISDPVDKQTYHLQPYSRTAIKTPRFDFAGTFHNTTSAVAVVSQVYGGPNNARLSGTVVRSRGPQASSATSTRVAPPPPPPPPPIPYPAAAVEYNRGNKQEPLGKQVIDGVEAEGTRSIQTIAAGAIGNERSFEIIQERWYSPELQVVMMAKHNDPRIGETIYRLTNINRSEPDASLFQVPSDYSIRESPTFGPAAREIEFRKSNDK